MTINLDKFCHIAAKTSSTYLGREVVPEQIKEAVGGIALLYLEHAYNNHLSVIKVNTIDGFVSDVVSLYHVLTEIRHCTGINESAYILKGMIKTLRQLSSVGDVFSLGGLGQYTRHEKHFRLRFETLRLKR